VPSSAESLSVAYKSNKRSEVATGGATRAATRGGKLLHRLLGMAPHFAALSFNRKSFLHYLSRAVKEMNYKIRHETEKPEPSPNPFNTSARNLATFIHLTAIIETKVRLFCDYFGLWIAIKLIRKLNTFFKIYFYS